MPVLPMSPRVGGQDQPDDKGGQVPGLPKACLAMSYHIAGGAGGYALTAFSMNEPIRICYSLVKCLMQS